MALWCECGDGERIGWGCGCVVAVVVKGCDGGEKGCAVVNIPLYKKVRGCCCSSSTGS